MTSGHLICCCRALYRLAPFLVVTSRDVCFWWLVGRGHAWACVCAGAPQVRSEPAIRPFLFLHFCCLFVGRHNGRHVNSMSIGRNIRSYSSERAGQASAALVIGQILGACCLHRQQSRSFLGFCFVAGGAGPARKLLPDLSGHGTVDDLRLDHSHGLRGLSAELCQHISAASRQPIV